MAEFDDLVAKLSRTHAVSYSTDDGTKYTTNDGLLQQLRDEMFGSNDKGAAAGNKTKLPFNAPATDLYQLIDRQISEVWAAAFKRVPGIETTEALLTEWAAWAGEHRQVIYSSPETLHEQNERGQDVDRVIWTKAEVSAINLLRRWVRAIEELFNPPRQAEIIAACILCGEREVWRPRDGQMVKQTALIFIRDRETGDSTEARCQACGATWVPSQFRYLAEKITENETLVNQS